MEREFNFSLFYGTLAVLLFVPLLLILIIIPIPMMALALEGKWKMKESPGSNLLAFELQTTKCTWN
jgi:hypothetical protein